MISFENVTVPLSLFTDDGEMISPMKSDSMHTLEEKVSQEITTSVKMLTVYYLMGYGSDTNATARNE